MNKKKMRTSVLCGCMVFLLSGCGLVREKDNTTDGDSADLYQVDYVESIDELEEDHYYIYHDGKYMFPYINNASFDIANDNSNSVGDSEVAWFNDDFKKIPTLYEGDYIVYYTSEELNEQFNIERYEYTGYTVGICGMKRMKSGRYTFDVNSGSSNKTINPDSDAARIMDEGAESVIIDNIGGAQLRSGNISRSGTIVGLQANKSYATDVYIGTQLKTYILKADSIALCSMEKTTTTDYTFLRSKVLRINLPDYLNDGYYNINGSGIFRYVKGKSYTSNTDFNVPNEIPNETGDVTEEAQQIWQDSNATVKEQFTVNKEGKITVNVTYGENLDVKYDIADPTGKVIGNCVVYTLTNNDTGQMSMTANLKAGTYTLEISGLYGRSYKYEVLLED